FERSNVETLWVGGEGGMEAALVQRAGIPFEAIPAAGVHGVGLKQLPRNLWRLLRGYFAARRILRRFKPDALFFTGGYLAVPMALAARRIPTLLFVPDIEPGLALKALAHFADCIALSAEASRKYFSRRAQTVVTGYPTRSGLLGWTRQTARQNLGLEHDHPVLLVFGGSKGARSLNNALLENLPALLELAQVVHLSGELDWPNVEAARKHLSKRQAARYHAFPYLHEEMGAALAAADLVVARAGASTLGEFPLFGLPAILVPYPHAWRYQKVNAEYLAGRGAAVMIEETQSWSRNRRPLWSRNRRPLWSRNRRPLSENLFATVNDLLNNPEKLGSMRAAMGRLSRPQAAADIAHQLSNLAGRRR
ncbi:MAG: UDP-N-acetylglucosamine--N-acetylmuramyl-(pentapeptide) pyrophosphoryl-undecaprenol N-acetylglucosamine transferase, partial [Chloroflexi bacterium]|nr:UDP-N-acetylglucosamine--N-acetylmuramyl-(pentapeptide) pyrophosphoryl-undecaprenol N-acetylglucosamine transferase [Chloroflexota bacterium]